ncbi:hypothetical protein GCM10010991_30580 [Gemmobacter aquaticus]|uniref:Uncharacterized protein n=1 Tax=Gemmobacter aquaticus TaxID=490185 RepID=A0A917YM38_9RHOB|nr:hypothetical protein GCM10010991_30580 [Gemmobacter aquaticus]
MHTVNKSGLGQIAQITADGLQCHVESMREIIDENTAFCARQREDLTLSDAQGQGCLPALPGAGQIAGLGLYSAANQARTSPCNL